ncbi:MAG: efflux RND transporter permease subunit, partial [Hyphomicrobiaceae bacterium]|nr:efflux RND transporter permease subunit [Hyphomicrobiaceae bacterium]
MMRWIVGLSLKFRYLVIAVAAGLIFLGFKQLREMPIDVFPEFAPPMVEIQTPSIGLSAQEVEELVSIPLEEALAGLPGLSNLRSKSVPALSSVKLYFKRGTDLMDARQLVAERIAQVTPSLPISQFPPMMLPPLSA